MAFDVQNIRKDFPILERKVHGHPLAYLDNAATSLKPKAVVDVIEGHYREGVSNVHRGVHLLSEQATALFDQSRSKLSKYLNAGSNREIVFTSGATHSLNLIAQTFVRSRVKRGDQVLVTQMEHHSNIVPWQLLQEELGIELVVAPINDAGEVEMDAFASMLTDKVKFVSVVHISNSLGTINPVEDMIELAREKGIPVLLDGAQSLIHGGIDVQALNCDFYVFSGHKFCAGTGTGGFYGKMEHLEAMPPYFGGGDMIRSVSFSGSTFAPPPMKFEAGTPNISGVISMGAAVDYLTSLDRPAMLAHEQDLLAYGTSKLSEIQGLRLIGTAQNKVPVLSFVMEGIHPHDLGTLVDQEGVAIRTGHHCTQPVMQRYAVPATARASLAFYNTRDDIDALVRALVKAKEVFQ